MNHKKAMSSAITYGVLVHDHYCMSVPYCMDVPDLYQRHF